MRASLANALAVIMFSPSRFTRRRETNHWHVDRGDLALHFVDPRYVLLVTQGVHEMLSFKCGERKNV